MGKDTRYSSALFRNTVNRLFILSESRGKEASGIAALIGDKLTVYKESVSARYFIRIKRYRQLLSDVINDAVTDGYPNLIRNPIAIIGHTRLATNGPPVDNNNCPIISGCIVGVHNGIIVNDEYLWKKFFLIERRGLVDSEVILSLLDFFIKSSFSLIEAVQATFRNIEGSASIAAFVSNSNYIILATNTGSLYSCRNIAGNVHIFASELPILQRLVNKFRLLKVIGQYNISQLKAYYACLINVDYLTEQKFTLR